MNIFKSRNSPNFRQNALKIILKNDPKELWNRWNNEPELRIKIFAKFLAFFEILKVEVFNKWLPARIVPHQN